jgi:hypothetical protein
MELILLLSILSLISNIILSCIVAHYGKKREIGYLNAFLVSFVFSPLMGFICVALSDKLTDKHNIPFHLYETSLNDPIVMNNLLQKLNNNNKINT